jgi:L-ribulose-5-phosphate 3-epimerase
MHTDGPGVFELARRIRGLAGVELQIHRGGETLWDKPTLNAYRQAARTNGIAVPSVAGVWQKGTTLMQSAAAEQSLLRAVDVAAELGARVVLVAAFKDNAPRMNDPASYGPVVEMLQKVAPRAKNVVLGMETSLSPADDRKLIDLVGHPAVRVYFDANNTEFYGHTGQGISGLKTLGVSRICQVHCKNEDKLLEESGRVDWAAYFTVLKHAAYSGWITFETRHAGVEQCVTETERNINFVRKCWASTM